MPYEVIIKWSDTKQMFVATSPQWQDLTGLAPDRLTAVRNLEGCISTAGRIMQTQLQINWSHKL